MVRRKKDYLVRRKDYLVRRKLCGRTTWLGGRTTWFDGWTTWLDGWTTWFDGRTTWLDGWTAWLDGWTTWLDAERTTRIGGRTTSSQVPVDVRGWEETVTADFGLRWSNLRQDCPCASRCRHQFSRSVRSGGFASKVFHRLPVLGSLSVSLSLIHI